MSVSPFPNDPGLLSPSPKDIQLKARGLLVESFELAAGRDLPTSLPGSGTQYCVLVGLAKGTVVNGIICLCQGSAGVAVTLFKMGLFSRAGALLGGTADLHASVAIGFISAPLAAPVQVPSDDGYYLCVLPVFTTTAPSLVRSVSAAPSQVSLNGGLPQTAASPGQVADLTSFALAPGSGIGWWMACF